MGIIFLAMLTLTALISVALIISSKSVTELHDIYVFKLLKGQKTEGETSIIEKLQFFAMLTSVVVLLFGLADIVVSEGFKAYNNAFIVMAGVVILENILLVVKYRNSKTFVFLKKAIATVAILELTVFQWSSYRLFFNSYQEQTINAGDVQYMSNNCIHPEDSDEVIVSNNEDHIIEFYDLDFPIGTVYFDVNFKNNDSIYISCDAKDEANAQDYLYGVLSYDLIKGRENTKYQVLNLSGDVSSFKVVMRANAEYQEFSIKSVTFNKQIPFSISIFRLLFLSLISTFVYAVIYSSQLKKSYKENQWMCESAGIVITGLLVMFSCMQILSKYNEGDFKKQFKLEEGNQITQELVDAFENHQVELLKKPSEALAIVENPYDDTYRYGIDYAWDHVYYNGHYYSYYGIAPVILLFLPYHLITGYYFSTDLAVLLFTITGLIFLSMAYLSIMRRWFSDIPSGLVMAGHVIISVASGIFYCTGRPLFYEISISSGFMFTMMGIYFLVSSRKIKDNKLSIIRSALASLAFGFATLSRPTLALYAVFAFLFFLYKTFSITIAEDETKKKLISKRILYFGISIAPLVILGILQMAYNYMRFDSFFDFGIKYSLTINDFTHAEYHTVFAAMSFVNYLLPPPEISATYPFINTAFINLPIHGYYFSDVGNTSGLLFLAPITFAYLWTFKVLKKIAGKKEKIKAIFLVGVPCLLIPFIIMFSVWESGYAVRYVADFSFEFIMGAIAIAFFVYKNMIHDNQKTLFRKVISISVPFTIVVSLVQAFAFTFSQDQFPIIADKFIQLISFWG